MMDDRIIEQVRNSGFKIKHLAHVIGVHKNTLSMALTQPDRNITPEQEDELKKFLNAIPQTT